MQTIPNQGGRPQSVDLQSFKNAYRKHGLKKTLIAKELQCSTRTIERFMMSDDCKQFLEEKAPAIETLKTRLKNAGYSKTTIARLNAIRPFAAWAIKKSLVRDDTELTPEHWLKYFGEVHETWSPAQEYSARSAARRYFKAKGITQLLDRTWSREHALNTNLGQIVGKHKEVYIPADKKMQLKKFLTEHNYRRPLLAVEIMPFIGARYSALAEMTLDSLADMDSRYYIKRYEPKIKQWKSNMIPKHVFELASEVLNHKQFLQTHGDSEFLDQLRQGYEHVGLYSRHEDGCSCGKCRVIRFGQKYFNIEGKYYFFTMPTHALKHDAVIGLLRKLRWSTSLVAKIVGSTTQVIENSYGGVPEDIMEDTMNKLISETDVSLNTESEKKIGS